MSRRYAPDHKTLVLKILQAHKGDVAAASRYTGVPARTLRDWLLELPPADRARVEGRLLRNVTKRRL
jgi:hypothetical protein